MVISVVTLGEDLDVALPEPRAPPRARQLTGQTRNSAVTLTVADTSSVVATNMRNVQNLNLKVEIKTCMKTHELEPVSRSRVDPRIAFVAHRFVLGPGGA